MAGLGGMGSAAASHLARRGKRVLGLDRYELFHRHGSSHGTSRIIRQAYFESPVYVPLLLRAYELWRALEQDSGAALFTVTGGVMIGSRDSAVFAGSLASAELHGLAHELLDAAEVRRRFPALIVAANEVALYEPNAGFVHPENTIRAHRELATRHGAELHFEEPIVSWSASSSGVSVTTSRGRYDADRLVLSAGPWASDLLGDLELPLTIERQVVYWFEPSGGAAPFRADRFPIWIWEVDDDLQLYGFPEENGRVKTAFYHAGPQLHVRPEEVDRQVHAEEVARVRAALATRVPALDTALADSITCLYTAAPDQHFVLGLHPDHANVVIASPCSGHGFKFVPVIGEILADLATEATTRHPIEPFRVTRFLEEA